MWSLLYCQILNLDENGVLLFAKKYKKYVLERISEWLALGKFTFLTITFQKRWNFQMT